MAANPDAMSGLGGRLPLLRPEALAPAQGALHDRLKGRGSSSDRPFRNATDAGELIGPFNALLHAPEFGAAFLALHEAEEKASRLGKRVREIVILAVGTAWQSDYELYAHRALALRAGLSAETVDRLIADDADPGLADDEQCAWTFARELATTRQVGDETYAAALACFGLDGVLSMTCLVATYHVISVLLNTFRVPAPPIER